MSGKAKLLYGSELALSLVAGTLDEPDVRDEVSKPVGRNISVARIPQVVRNTARMRKAISGVTRGKTTFRNAESRG